MAEQPPAQAFHRSGHGGAGGPSYTGWPWSERHDYTHVHAESSTMSTTSLRVPTGQEEYGFSTVGGGMVFNASQRLQQAVVVVLFLNAIVIILEALFISVPEAKLVLKLCELGLTMSFLLLLARALRAEAISISEALSQKQVTATAEINEETMRTVRGAIASLREIILDKEACAHKDLRGQLSRVEAAAVEARAEAAALRHELGAARATAEAAKLLVDATSQHIAELRAELASVRGAAAMLPCEVTAKESASVAEPQDDSLNEVPILEELSLDVTRDSVKPMVVDSSSEDGDARATIDHDMAGAGDVVEKEMTGSTDKVSPERERGRAAAEEPSETAKLPKLALEGDSQEE